jgi:hypothetical protein
MRPSSFAAIILFVVALPAVADTGWDHWNIKARHSKVERYLGRDALFLDDGTAWLDDANFQDGIIEFDVAASVEPGFHGLAFRAADHDNYEEVYLRSHLSDKPDATQYTPVFNGLWGWQIYSGPRFTQQVTIVPDRWVHVRVVVHGQRLELSVDGKTVVFPQMIRPAAAGAVGFNVSLTPAHFANFVMTRGENPPPEGGDGAPAVATPAGVTARWRVSTTFAEKRLDSLGDLDPASWRDLTWDSLESSTGGIANLAMLRKLDGGRNTVFAATTLHADEARRVLLHFGFSDRVRVYLNGRPLYRGNDAFQTRDRVFLGTVGLFDELILPLKRGDNELWFAVSENFGGWAVVAQLP